MPAIQTSVELVGLMSAKEQFHLLTMSPIKRKRFLQQAARLTQKQARQRIRRQRDIQGRAFTPRKGKGRKKMLRGLSRQLRAYANPHYAMVDFKNGLTGFIAREQQEGIDEVMTARKMQQRDNTSNDDSPATRSQAKKLRALNYKIRRDKGKGWKRPSLKWMVNNLSQKQAGLIIKVLKNEHSKQSWIIPLPARAFLGASETDIRQLIQHYFSTQS